MQDRLTLSLRRAQILVTQMRNPSVDQARWIPSLEGWLQDARVAAAKEDTSFHPDELRSLENAGVLAGCLANLTPPDQLSCLAELHATISELLRALRTSRPEFMRPHGNP